MYSFTFSVKPNGELDILYAGLNAGIAYDAYEKNLRNPDIHHLVIIENAKPRTEATPKQDLQRIAESKAAAQAEAKALANRAKTDAESAVEAARKALEDAQAKLSEFVTPPVLEEPEKPKKARK